MTLTPTQKRQRLGSLMDTFVAHRAGFRYRQLRPMASQRYANLPEFLAALAQPGGVAMDCSEAVTLLCRFGETEDPTNFNYDGYGNSGSMWRYLPHYLSPAAALVGAIVTFGPGGTEHVTMVRNPGPDPVLFSHGGADGPHFISLSAEVRAHPLGHTFCSITALL